MVRKEPATSPSPGSTDLEGWRAAIKTHQLSTLRPEDMIAALQDLGPEADIKVRNELAKEVHGRFHRYLRRLVGPNHPNRGDDIIHRTIFKLFEAIATIGSKDGLALRHKCYPRIKVRMYDAMKEERRERGLPAQVAKKGKSRDAVGGEVTILEADDIEDAENSEVESRTVVSSEADWAAPPPEASADDENEDAPPGPASDPSALLEAVNEMQQAIDVKRLLENAIADDRKRLAFRLYMEGVPSKTNDENTHSIAEALGKDERTIRGWIKEIQDKLKTKVSQP
jgi:RNA polymerase sigma factor (sigma-70 family)